jgi:hypothetical protein
VLQRFDSSEKSWFCSKTALPKCLKINDWLFCLLKYMLRICNVNVKCWLTRHCSNDVSTEGLGISAEGLAAETRLDHTIWNHHLAAIRLMLNHIASV